ncbi:MAG: DUF4062 domain-containing protein [Xanthomonadales bacterium]|nr:DUF4062 domain-containing protein [Xanthomonadales bacterium]
MSYQATVFKIMIASPSDVLTERAIIREIISEWNVVNAEKTQRVLLSIGWETHAVPDMGDRPQSIINKQILHGCDLLVGVFWTRIGTATEDFISGSVEEIEEHIKAGKSAMIYFSSAPVMPESINQEQYGHLQSFKKSCQSRGLYESYSDINEFRSKFYRQIQLKLNQDKYFQNELSSKSGADLVSLDPIPNLSKEAGFLLKECASDDSGMIANLSYMEGHMIQVNGKNVVEEGSDRSRAIWSSALLELEDLGYIEAVNNKRQMFRMTHAGYVAADRWG